MTTVAFVTMVTATAPFAYAQTTTQSGSPSTAPSPTTTQSPATPHGGAASRGSTSDSFATDEGQLRAAKIIGSTVYDVQNEKVGSVEDVLLDHGGRVQSVVLDVGTFLGMGGKYVSVPLNDLKTDNDRLTLSETKAQLKSAPEFHFHAS